MLCGNDSIVLTATAGTSYNWSNGATTQSIKVAAGTFTVSVTNSRPRLRSKRRGERVSQSMVWTPEPTYAKPDISVRATTLYYQIAAAIMLPSRFFGGDSLTAVDIRLDKYFVSPNDGAKIGLWLYEAGFVP